MVVFEKLIERPGFSAEEHRKVGRDGILGSAVGRRNVGQVEGTPVWDSRRELTGFEVFRHDWLIRDHMASKSGERRRDFVVAVRDGSGQ